MQRHTFVVQVHPHGHSTLENLSTSERRRIDDLSEVGPQIERWLADLSPEAGKPPARPEPAPG